MTAMSEMVNRALLMLQDEAEAGWSQNRVLTQMQDEMSRLSRRNVWSQVQWLQGVAGQSQYTLVGQTSEVHAVVYNEHRIDYATEDSLSRRWPDWEFRAGEPRYWTDTDQASNVIRIVPAPVATGSAIPVFPPYPLISDPVNNLIIFAYEDLRADITDLVDDFPANEFWEDVVVYRTVQVLASEEGDYQNLPLSGACKQLADNVMVLLGVTP